MKPYRRVIPRDLFNESKLLKCMGQLSLLLHDGVGIKWPLVLEHDDEYEPFRIEQSQADGGLWILNLRLKLKERPIFVFSSYNSKSPYPMNFLDWNEAESPLFTDQGKFTDEFINFLDQQGEPQ